MPHGIDGLETELVAQREIFGSREPGYARVLELVREALPSPLGARLAEAWAERSFNAFYERPLLLLAALRYDALCDGMSHPLRTALTGVAPSGDDIDMQAIELATDPSRERFFSALRERAVQTNETSRAVTWLWPAHLIARAGEARPMTLVDLGSSAGLNLIADDLPMIWTDEAGLPLQVAPRLEVSARLGFDIAPLDVRSDEAALWLRSCVWASDSARLLRLEEGVACFRTHSTRPSGPRLQACSLPDVPAQLAAQPHDALLFCVQSIVRDYLSDEDRERYEHNMRGLLVSRPAYSMIWSQLELDPNGGTMERGAAITLRFVDATNALRVLVLAHTHPHPKQLFRDAAACEQLLSAWSTR